MRHDRCIHTINDNIPAFYCLYKAHPPMTPQMGALCDLIFPSAFEGQQTICIATELEMIMYSHIVS